MRWAHDTWPTVGLLELNLVLQANQQFISHMHSSLSLLAYYILLKAFIIFMLILCFAHFVRHLYVTHSYACPFKQLHKFQHITTHSCVISPPNHCVHNLFHRFTSSCVRRRGRSRIRVWSWSVLWKASCVKTTYRSSFHTDIGAVCTYHLWVILNKNKHLMYICKLR